MKLFYLSLIIILIFSSLLLAQDQSNKPDSSYISTKLIDGVPISLKNNGYFSQPGNISYAVIYENEADSIYFIVKRLNSDTSIYVLVYTSGGRITSYDFLSFEKAADNRLFAEDEIKDFNIKLFYSDKADTIQYKVKKRVSEIPVVVSKPKSEYDAFFMLGFEDKIIFAYEQYRSPFPLNIHFVLGASFLKYYRVYMRLGFMVVNDNFEGMDGGIFFKAGLFKTDIYAKAGVDFFSMMGQLPHGLTYNRGGFPLYCLGIGYNVTRQFSVDAMYYIPGSRIIVDHNESTPEFIKQNEAINRGFISIDFQVSFFM